MKAIRIDGPTREAVFYAREGDHLTYALEHGYYEADLLEAIRARQIEGDYFDVGAHIGNHSVFFALECRVHQVFAIESNPDSYVILCANVLTNDLYGRIECLNAAVHPRWTNVHITHGPDENSGMAGIALGGPIPALRLDDLQSGRIGLIKIDTEGASLDVLKTAKEILYRDHPLIAAETITGVEFRAVSDFLAGFGYVDVDGPYAITPVYLFS